MPLRVALAFGLPVLLGVVLGGFAPAPQPAKFVETICASQDVPAGIPLDDARFRRCSFPKGFLASDAISDIEPTRTIDRAIKRGDPVQRGWLGPPRTIVGRKLRSVPLTLLRREALAPFLEVGDFVDVLWVRADPAPSVMHLVQFVSVADIVPADAEHVMVVLNVGPEEAELLANAQRAGRLVLTLRHPDNIDVIEEKGVATINSINSERLAVLLQKRFNTHCSLIRGGLPEEPDAGPIGPPRPTRGY